MYLTSEEFDDAAHQLYEAGEYDAALCLLREGLLHHPASADLHVALGYVHFARDEYVWASRSFGRALELDDEHEDAWVGLGEANLKFGRVEVASRCFARVDELGSGTDGELGLAIAQALFREGIYSETRDRLLALMHDWGEWGEVRATLAYTYHALGDDSAACRELHLALQLDPELHEARTFLSRLLLERGDLPGFVREMERVPPNEHWDQPSVWRFIELKCSLEGLSGDDELLTPWRERWRALQAEPDALDHLLAEVEMAFEERLLEPMQPKGNQTPGPAVHRVRTTDGQVFSGRWGEIVQQMRAALSDRSDPLALFVRTAAHRVRSLTGGSLPCEHAEALLRDGARKGLLWIES